MRNVNGCSWNGGLWRCPLKKEIKEMISLTFKEFKNFIAGYETAFCVETLYAEYLENGYFCYTDKNGNIKETY